MPSSNSKEAKLDSDADSSLDISATQSALEDIDACQNEIDTLNEKASEEILTVEQKFNKLRRPHYIKRSEIIQKIPKFWHTAFINHPQISFILNDEEQECLKCLTQVDVEEFEDIKSGYRISLSFTENEYFTNEVLTKEFHLASTGEPQSKSTKVEWKEGKDLTLKPKHENNGRKRHLGMSQSFFSWFVNNSDPSNDDIAEVIKDDMWPNPLQYFLASEIEVSGENGHSDDDEYDDVDESVVEIGEDSDEDEDGEGVEAYEDEDEHSSDEIEGEDGDDSRNADDDREEDEA